METRLSLAAIVLAATAIGLAGCGGNSESDALERALNARGEKAALKATYDTAYDACRNTGPWTQEHQAPIEAEIPDSSFDYAREHSSTDAERIAAQEGCWHGWAGWKRSYVDIEIMSSG